MSSYASVCCPNGALDLQARQFRARRPEDGLLETGVPYRPYLADAKLSVRLEEGLARWMPSEDNRRWLFLRTALSLAGHSRAAVYALQHPQGNMVSWISLCQQALGGYCCRRRFRDLEANPPPPGTRICWLTGVKRTDVLRPELLYPGGDRSCTYWIASGWVPEAAGDLQLEWTSCLLDPHRAPPSLGEALLSRLLHICLLQAPRAPAPPEVTSPVARLVREEDGRLAWVGDGYTITLRDPVGLWRAMATETSVDWEGVQYTHHGSWRLHWESGPGVVDCQLDWSGVWRPRPSPDGIWSLSWDGCLWLIGQDQVRIWVSAELETLDQLYALEDGQVELGPLVVWTEAGRVCARYQYPPLGIDLRMILHLPGDLSEFAH